MSGCDDAFVFGKQRKIENVDGAEKFRNQSIMIIELLLDKKNTYRN